VLAALHHRQRTGLGQDIDLSSTEVMSAMMGHAFLDYQLSGVVPGQLGNRDEWMAPHGCYACRGEGELGGWVTIAVDGDAEWAAFRRVLADPALDAEDFTSAEARKQNEDRLDERVEAWTRARTGDEIVKSLQAAGVAAGKLQTGTDLARDPHVAAREVYVPIVHPLLGGLRVVRPPWRMVGARISEPAPLLGQHNDYVLGEILGLSADEIARLAEAEIVY
jgi:crotonobetainyl-CoA:carnitine CoA-transferase CaiB-like acyl-CoA transferase